MGFEPTKSFDSALFKSAAINHSATSPVGQDTSEVRAPRVGRPTVSDQLSCFLYGGSWNEDVFLPVTKIYKSGPKKGQEYVRNEFQHTLVHHQAGYFKPLKGTEVAKSTPEKRLYQTGDEVLQQLRANTKVQRRIIDLLRSRSKLEKLVGTYLLALPAMCDSYGWGDVVHGQFNQVVARTGRLSSSKPNMQNAPAQVDQFFVSRYAA